MKKRILSLIMAIVACIGLCLGLAACGEEAIDPLSTYSTKFHTNKGSAIETRYGIIKTEPVPERIGYQFAGWFDDSSLNGERITFPYTPQSSGDLYAAWQLTDSKAAVVQFFKDEQVSRSSYLAIGTVTYQNGKYIYERSFSPTEDSLYVYQFVYDTVNDYFTLYGNFVYIYYIGNTRNYLKIATNQTFFWGEFDSNYSLLNEISYYRDQGANKDLLLIQTNLYTISTISHTETSATIKFTANANNSYSRLALSGLIADQETEEKWIKLIYDDAIKYANDFLYYEPYRI